MESRRVEINLEKYQNYLKETYPLLDENTIKEFLLCRNNFLQEYHFLFTEKENF